MSCVCSWRFHSYTVTHEYMCKCACVYIYIYIERERERERCIPREGCVWSVLCCLGGCMQALGSWSCPITHKLWLLKINLTKGDEGNRHLCSPSVAACIMWPTTTKSHYSRVAQRELDDTVTCRVQMLFTLTIHATFFLSFFLSFMLLFLSLSFSLIHATFPFFLSLIHATFFLSTVEKMVAMIWSHFWPCITSFLNRFAKYTLNHLKHSETSL